MDIQEIALRDFILSKYKSIREFTQIAGIPYSTIDSVLKRGVKKSSIDSIIKICEALEINLDCLVNEGRIVTKDAFVRLAFGTSYGVQTLGTNSNGVIINVLGRVAAGIPIEAMENIIDTEEISEEMAKTGEFFGLQIKGDSMEPRIYEGDIVIVRKQEDAESGDIVIALVNGNDATCKRLTKYAGGISLVSLNSAKYEPMMFSNEEIDTKPVKIIGKVVELRGKL